MSTETSTTPTAVAPQQLMTVLMASVLMGILSAIVASLFLLVVEKSQEFLYHDMPHAMGLEGAPWWWAGIILGIAAVIVVFARTLPGNTGKGPLTGFHFDTPLKFVPAVILAALASLIGGVALGPEAPLIVLGTTLGALFTIGKPENSRKAMMFIGGAAAIGAVFGNPFITGFMILEFAALGAAPAALLLPVFTALASSYIVSIGIWQIPGLGVHSLTVPGLPAYASIQAGDLLAGLLIALVAAVVAVLTRKGGLGVDRIAKKWPTLMLFGAALITTIVLLVGETVFHLNPNQILFSGNDGMPELIAQTSLAAVIFILTGKSIAFAAALGGGFRGGPIFPATFLGVAVGVLGSLLLPDANVSALAAAGIAASAAAFTKLPATSALLGALLIAGTGAAIAPFAIFGAVIGLLTRLLTDRRSERATVQLDA
ncbi:H+/Cl- antiporter ClcA [Aurantimicrobium minutum]|uniref:chloride channel protein n=1 Tax=Aurantimicrobium minutum TaxID=708131 RepID=UPI002474C1CF|nr:chloride channel protein [Aurantimicrobium minutum]MDH6532822.1 H+/Cl- antiporter ClcA [Aurantimicrobium minutum]